MVSGCYAGDEVDDLLMIGSTERNSADFRVSAAV